MAVGSLRHVLLKTGFYDHSPVSLAIKLIVRTPRGHFGDPNGSARRIDFVFKQTLITVFIAAISLTGGFSSQAGDPANMKIDFQSRQEMNLWWPVNDGVMGGRSSGGPAFENGNLLFSGTINTNGGGFSSIRRQIATGDLSGARSITLRIKSDGRGYNLRFRSDVTWRGRRVAFQKPIQTSTPGQWETVTVTLDNMRASLFGRDVRGAHFVPAQAVETGIILADGKDGPFQLEIDWIAVN